ncbi:VOC family protein [Colwellia psychrerythraea]|uniref:Glyoxalase-like domain containing protein n=1 Tax=Colwellia psychrerythraea TaxID=28229 RepID=A0A099KXG5_COLPS|nr:VOC family protein [Colwellia psychrerythraea]KGJ94343.1 Glyoxalase-like domain containing protein [Colwellia psychrerythraea]
MKGFSQFFIALLLPLFFYSHALQATHVETTNQEIIKNQHGKLVWADLYTGDVEASLKFYQQTFDWTVKAFAKEQSKYHLLYDNGLAVAGVLERDSNRNKTDKALWVGSIDTDSVSSRSDRAAKNNATIILAPHDFTLYGKRSVLADPQGGIIALLELDLTNKNHKKISKKWDWAQLFSTNTRQAAMFYQDTFGYSLEATNTNNDSYFLIQAEMVQASIVKLPESFEQRDRWVNFIEVNNLSTTLTKAKNNGATVIYHPTDRGLAIIADPNGALLGLTQQESE